MKNRHGFTLVELLAVIAILAILVIIALPNVMGMFNEAKKNSFSTEVKEIYKVASQQWIMDSMMSTGEQVYTRCKTCTGKGLDLSGRSELDYYIKLNKAGNVVEYHATDGTYQYSYFGDGLKVENINIDEIKQVSDLGDEDPLTISDSGPQGVNRPSYFDSEYCVFKDIDGSKEYFPYKSGMTWKTFHDYIVSGNDLEGYSYNFYAVYLNSNEYLPNDPNINTYLNDPNSNIDYSLKYKNNQMVNYFSKSRYGEYFETLDGFGTGVDNWNYISPEYLYNQPIKSANEGCYTPGWG